MQAHTHSTRQDRSPGVIETRVRPDRALCRELGAVAAGLYAADTRWSRFVTRYRPRICPFDRVLAHVPPGVEVLDIGCGRGLLLGLLASGDRQPRRAVGFDVSAAAIHAARAMAAAGGLEHLVFQPLDAGREWQADDYDVVMMIDVMHHLPIAQRRSIFARAARRVRPGGRLIYKDMARRPRWRMWMNRLHDLVLTRQRCREEPIERVVHWAGDAGLTLVAAERIDMLWYGHELRVFEQPATTAAATAAASAAASESATTAAASAAASESQGEAGGD